MTDIGLTVQTLISEQTNQRMAAFPPGGLGREVVLPVITVCMQPGSGGHVIAAEIANRLNFKLYDKKLLVLMANMADVDRSRLDTIEKGRPAGVHDFISSLIDEKYVFTGDYLRDLKSAVKIISNIGNGVIVGRGANFILPPKGRFSIRVVAPLDIRVKNISFKFGVSLSEAQKRIKYRENRRKTFIKETFNKKIDDVSHYDLVINTARMDLETSVETAIGAIIGSQVNRAFNKDISYILRNKK